MYFPFLELQKWCKRSADAIVRCCLNIKIAALPVWEVPLSVSKKPRRVCRPQAAKKLGIIFCRGVYLAENTSQAERRFPFGKRR